jgi:hypothetical protein
MLDIVRHTAASAVFPAPEFLRLSLSSSLDGSIFATLTATLVDRDDPELIDVEVAAEAHPRACADRHACASVQLRCRHAALSHFLSLRTVCVGRPLVTYRRRAAKTWRMVMNLPPPHHARIRVLNDNFRMSFLGGTVVFTQMVAELPLDLKARAILAVQAFEAFDADNDPHHEHDFGSFELAGEKYFFKIDYLTLDMSAGSEDPADPEVTKRVMTIMHASEY